MKKTVSILLAILLGMSIFAGCGKGKEEASKDTTKTEKETEGGEESSYRKASCRNPGEGLWDD